MIETSCPVPASLLLRIGRGQQGCEIHFSAERYGCREPTVAGARSGWTSSGTGKRWAEALEQSGYGTTSSPHAQASSGRIERRRHRPGGTRARLRAHRTRSTPRAPLLRPRIGIILSSGGFNTVGWMD